MTMRVGVKDEGTIEVMGTAGALGLGVLAATPVVLLHAFPVDGRMWDRAAAQMLAQGSSQPELSGLRILAFNTPGTPGVPVPTPEESGPEGPDGTYPEAIGRLAHAFVDRLGSMGYDRAIWVGLSMGGYEALAIQKAVPEAVAGLALCDSTPRADDERHRAGRMEMARRALGEEGPEAVMKFARPQEGDSAFKRSAEFIDTMTGWIRDQPGEGLYWREQMAGGRPDLTPALDSLTAPFLVVSGQRDPSAGPKVMQPFAQRVAGSTFVEIPDAGHFSAFEKPAPFAAAILGLASSVAAAGRR